MAAVTRSRSSVRSGYSGDGMATVARMRWSLTETDFTIWRSTTERFSSGSSTGCRASITSDSVGTGLL